MGGAAPIIPVAGGERERKERKQKGQETREGHRGKETFRTRKPENAPGQIAGVLVVLRLAQLTGLSANLAHKGLDEAEQGRGLDRALSG